MIKRKKLMVEIAEMNLTPMIDVTFLLLIFFILGARFKEPEGRLDAHLPKDKGPPQVRTVQDSPVEELIVRVRMRGPRMYYQIGELEFGGINSLEIHLRQLFPVTRQADGNPQPVTIDPEPLAPYRDVLSVLDACMRVGYKEISFSAPIPQGTVKAGDPHTWH